jgi:hypothetical protein
MLVWQDHVLEAGVSPELPTDLIAPGNEVPPVYYWDHVSGSRQESTDRDFIMVPMAEMSDVEVEAAKISMIEGIVPTKYTQAGKVVQGDKVGLVIFA